MVMLPNPKVLEPQNLGVPIVFRTARSVLDLCKPGQDKSQHNIHSRSVVCWWLCTCCTSWRWPSGFSGPLYADIMPLWFVSLVCHPLPFVMINDNQLSVAKSFFYLAVISPVPAL